MKLLLVDDDPAMRLIVMKKVLNHFSFNITEATSGNEAIAHLKSGQYQLIICDQWMQNGSGSDVATFLEKMPFITTPIIFFSSDNDIVRQYLINSSYNAILKPRLNELLIAIERLGFQRKVQQ